MWLGGHIANRSKISPNINYIGIDFKGEVLAYALRKVKKARAEESISIKIRNVRLMPLNIMFIENVLIRMK